MYDNVSVEEHNSSFYIVVQKKVEEGSLYLHTAFSTQEDAETCKRLLSYIQKEWTDVRT